MRHLHRSQILELKYSRSHEFRRRVAPGAKESGGVASRLKPPIHYFLGAAGFSIPTPDFSTS